MQRISHKNSPAERRARSYMPIAEQLDALVALGEALRDSGAVDLSPKVLAWLEHCQAVKADNPK